MNTVLHYLKLALLTAGLLVLSSCGGGGGGGGSSSGSSGGGTTQAGAGEILISGLVAKGTVLNATVRATQIINGQLSGTQKDVALGTNGDFSVSMPKGLIHLQVIPQANSITQDEATGVAVALPPEFKFRAAADLTDSTAATVTLNITPFSEAGVALAAKSGGLSAANINKANSGIANILGFDHLSTKPIQSNDSVRLASATENEKKLSVLNAAVSNIAATDALGCGVKASYGQTIDCTVAKLADQFQMNDAPTTQVGAVQTTTANSTPMVILGDTGYQAVLGGIANAAGSAATALANTTVNLVQQGTEYAVSSFTYAVTSISTAVSASQKEAVWGDYQKSIIGRSDLIQEANNVYTYAVMSDLAYKDTPAFGPESIWVNGRHPNEPLNPLNDRTGVYAVASTYTVLNWQTYGIDPSAANSVGLQWGVFVNDKEIVFAYRGTEFSLTLSSILDLAADVNILACNSQQFATALTQFDALVTNPQFINDYLKAPNKKRIVLTGHSLGGGIASYIATWSRNSSIIDLAVGFNSAPLCSATAALSGVSPTYRDPKIVHIEISGEPVSLVPAVPLPLPGWGYFPGNSISYPNPFMAVANLLDSHYMSTVLFVLDAAKDLCPTTPSCVAQIPTQSTQTPTGSNLPLVVSGIQSSYSTGITPYRPSISLTGTNLSAINQISWACTQPNGAACPNSPYVWTPNDWAGKVDIHNDTSITVYPGLLGLADAAGTYNWTATFSAPNSTPISIPFSVTYQPQAATGIIVDGLSSPQFTAGTTTVASTTSPVVPALTVTGKNLGTVTRIEWRWTGAANGSATWHNSDATWSSKVAFTSDGKLVLSPIVVEANPSWTGTAMWTGTLMDATGVSRNITFAVNYTPPISVTCIPPQVPNNGACVAPTPTITLSASPSSIASGATSTINWSATNSTSCTSSGGGGNGTAGSFITPPLTTATTYTVTCTGSGGTVSKSVTIAVTAPTLTNGTCGSSDGATLSSIPTANLCAAGTASAVTGTGPWSWSCSGSNGGTSASCSAAKLTTTTPPSIITTSLPSATVGTAYSQIVAVSGGQSPYTWSISSGGLPSGLSINSTSGAITGTPSASGSFNFAVTATDSSSPQKTASQALSLTVTSTYTVTPSAGAGGTISPNTPQTVVQGATVKFVVTANTGFSSQGVMSTCGGAGTWVGTTYTTNAISANCSVAASFTPIGPTGNNQFTDNGNGTVTDKPTGLTWQQGENALLLPNWYQAVGTYDVVNNTTAQNFCGSLSLAGGGWRLPTRTELESLIDSSFNPTINTNYFPQAYANSYWSSTPDTSNFQNAWMVSFSYGYAYSGNKVGGSYVRCVRGGATQTYTVTPSAGTGGSISPSTPQTVVQGASTTFILTPNTGYVASVGGTCGGSVNLSGNTYTTNAITANCTVVASFTISSVSKYTDNGNGTVTDNTTGLTWQNGENSTSGNFNWYQATGTYDATRNPSSQNICGSLSLAGGGWRLPSSTELQSLVDKNFTPTINPTYFPNAHADIYWSSTTFANYTAYAWYVYFGGGSVSSDDKANVYYVRCVR